LSEGLLKSLVLVADQLILGLAQLFPLDHGVLLLLELGLSSYNADLLHLCLATVDGLRLATLSNQRL